MKLHESQRILEQLSEYLRTVSGKQFDEAIVIYTPLKKWAESGASEPIPFVAELRNFGIQVPEPLIVDAETAKFEVLSEPKMSHNTSVVQTDNRITYEEAIKLLNKGDVYRAYRKLGELRHQTTNPLKKVVEDSYQIAKEKLLVGTQDRIAYAVEFAAKNPDDPTTQLQAWQAVLRFNDESAEANDAITRLMITQNDRKIGDQIDLIMINLKHAEDRLDLPSINKCVGTIQSLRTLGESKPPTISHSLYDKILTYETEIVEIRQHVRSRLGQYSTLLASGDYRKVYELARDYLERGVPTLIDSAGQFGPANEEVSSIEIFRAAREKFLPSLISLSSQRMDTAIGQEKEDPEGARETLRDALRRLDDDVLTSDDKVELARYRKPLEEKLAEIERRLVHFGQARQKIVEAHSINCTVDNAIRLVIEAGQIYPDYPNIQMYMQEARDNLSNVVAANINDVILKAQRQAARDDYQTALETISNARRAAIQQIPTPKPHSYLSQVLEDLTDVERQIVLAENKWYQLLSLLAEIDKEIEKFDNGDSRGLAFAKALLAQVSESERMHSEFRKRSAAIMIRQ